MISPVDIEHYNILNSRFSKGQVCDKAYIFTPETNYILARLMGLLVQSEVIFERRRQSLNAMPRFTIRRAFDRIDKHGRNYLIKEEV